MSKVNLAGFVGVNHRMITAYEAGEKAPSEETLLSLSRALRFPVDFFKAPEIELVEPQGASFRSLSSMTSGERDMVLMAASLALTANQLFETRFQLPVAQLPDLRDHEPEAASMELRAQWGLGVQSITNVVQLLEAKGIRIFSLSDTCARSVDGFSLWSKGTPFIFLNPKKSGERGRFDVSHELAHLVLHQHGGPRGREAEQEADQFASAFLMPSDSVISVMPKLVSIESLLELKKFWNVSAVAIAKRLIDLNLINSWQYRTLSIEIARRGWRVNEPDGIPRESSSVLKQIFALLREEGSTGRAHLAKELHISISEFDSLAYGLVPVALEGGGGRAGGQKTANLHLIGNS